MKKKVTIKSKLNQEFSSCAAASIHFLCVHRKNHFLIKPHRNVILFFLWIIYTLCTEAVQSFKTVKNAKFNELNCWKVSSSMILYSLPFWMTDDSGVHLELYFYCNKLFFAVILVKNMKIAIVFYKMNANFYIFSEPNLLFYSCALIFIM